MPEYQCSTCGRKAMLFKIHAGTAELACDHHASGDPDSWTRVDLPLRKTATSEVVRRRNSSA